MQHEDCPEVTRLVHGPWEVQRPECWLEVGQASFTQVDILNASSYWSNLELNSTKVGVVAGTIVLSQSESPHSGK